jgi:tetratricopeptide (TPR) repeat protein
MIIHREMEKKVTAQQDLAMLRAAYGRSLSPVLRARLANLLFLEEAFADIIALLSPAHDLGFAELIVLGSAHLSLETAGNDQHVTNIGDKALAVAENAEERATALAMRGKAEMRLGDQQGARSSFETALQIDPANKDACKRLAALMLTDQQPEAVVDMTARLITSGNGHARLLAAKALAETRLGDIAAARKTNGFDQFFHQEMLEPPAGWESLDAFNAALAKELTTHPSLRYERYGSASELTWRVEAPAHPKAPTVKLLLDQIEAAIVRIIAQLPARDHPWTIAKPQRGFLRSWCVITESKGFENWHVHQFGWLSGVYYVRIPDSIANGGDLGGCLAFGLPSDLAGEEGSAQYGEHVVRPQEGMLLAFPSHTYHRTYPHGSGEKRICFAFDLRPM